MPDSDKKYQRQQRQKERIANGKGRCYERRLTFDDIKDERALSMVDKLCVWLGDMLGIKVNRGTILAEIRNGGKLCKLAVIVTESVEKYIREHPEDEDVPNLHPPKNFCEDCGPRTDAAQENVTNFLKWVCEMGVPQSTVFEPKDLLKLKGKMKVVNTLLNMARRAKTMGVELDVDAPPKINNAFKGLEKKFGSSGTSQALSGGGSLAKSTITLGTYSRWKAVQQKLDFILQLPGNVKYEIFRESDYMG